MARDALHQSGLHKGESQSRLKTPCEKIEPLKNDVRLRRAQASSSHATHAATMDNERDDALIALAVLARYRGSACGSEEVRARMLFRDPPHGVIVSRSRGQWRSDTAHRQFESLTVQVMGSYLWSWYVPLCNCLEHFVACVA
jgi:hypothetical protein